MSPLEPLLEPWRGRLAAAAVQLGSPLAPEALEGLVDGLRNRLERAAGPVLGAEQAAAEHFGRDLDRRPEAWIERWDHYPALRSLVDRIAGLWLTASVELIERLEADREDLGALLGRETGRLRSVRAEAGDPHAGGRSVVLLDLDGGRVAYKPKDLRLVAAVHGWFRRVAELGLEPDLHARPLLCREGWTWDPVVEPTPCVDAAEVRPWFERYGIALRLLQLLGARDLWADNLVSAGPHPVWVDLEMALHPPRTGPTGRTAAEAVAWTALAQTVALPCSLVLTVPIRAGVRRVDLGGLAPPGRRLLPFTADPATERALGREGAVDGFRTFEPTAHAPRLDGRPVPVTEHLDALIAGYERAHAFLVGRRHHLEADLEGLRGPTLRYVHRSTWDGYHLCRASVRPERLVSEGARASWLDRWAQGAGPLGQAEVAAVRDLDLPWFTARTDGRDVSGPEGVLHRDFFPSSAWDGVRRRIAALGRPDPATEPAWIRATLATGDHGRWSLRREEAEGGLEAAVTLGDTLLADAVATEDELCWLGWTHDPFHGRTTLDRLGPDLLSGSAGIAMVFAELAAATGLDRFRAAAFGALASTRARLGDPVRRGPHGEPPAVGALVGIGSGLLALRHVARVLDEAAFEAEARRVLAALDLDTLTVHASVDPWTGLSGLLLAALPDGPGDPLWPIALRLADAVSARRQELPPHVADPWTAALPPADQALGWVGAIAGPRLGRTLDWGPIPAARSPGVPQLASDLAGDRWNRGAVHGTAARVRAALYSCSNEVSSADHDVLKMVHQSSLMPFST